ncbi:MAG: hypothetical protein QGH85_01235 [Candidatus Pacebacteria bacterium]|jgi:hypothetical protein|nr:hypothetical protein [Parcubacteria group bacterium]MDP7159477.1 hypothetical protein [Candidatus Paceibacterota bacterium]MDP7365979.1 hypothetical protein [Candidatus Paceibacterota bacterium]MDP7466228.1 hypothetical protein [Candidatus Paceibacterota bacterium]MDP7648354.1 hypothetical protein [Candidatus Paceibacterota bacterium]|tara:strand:+ start:133 stop:1047 length:915 start_codon:yes stop_codon:yes gene_type:complete
MNYKKIILIVAIIIVVSVAGIISKVTYDKIRETVIQREINKTLLEMGVSPEEIDLSGFDFTEFTNEEIYDIVSKELSKQITEASSGQATSYSSETYICTADPSVTNRGYVVIEGAGGSDTSKIKNNVSAGSHFGGFLNFTYDSSQETLDTIGTRFVSEFNTFATQEFDEIIIYGLSAGGVIASYTAHLLGDTTLIEIHTHASPLNGYKFGPAAEQISQQFTGFLKEIGLGIDPYIKPPTNIKVFHHKTVEDQTLRSFCGDYASLCNPKVIQDNNVPGSSEFIYPNDTHESITNTVVTKTLSCKK